MKWLQLIFTWLPTILKTVVAVEDAAKGLNIPGANKKQVILDIITTGAKGAEEIPVSQVQQVGGLIDTVVGALNKSGIFSKSGVV